MRVGTDARRGEVPGPGVGLAVRGQRLVGTPPVARLAALIGDRSHEGMREAEVLLAHSQHAGRLGVLECAGRESSSRQAAIRGASCRSTEAEATTTADRPSGPRATSRASNASSRAASPTGTGSIGARPSRCSSVSRAGSSRSARGLPPAVSSRDSTTFDAASGVDAATAFARLHDRGPGARGVQGCSSRARLPRHRRGGLRPAAPRGCSRGVATHTQGTRPTVSRATVRRRRS